MTKFRLSGRCSVVLAALLSLVVPFEAASAEPERPSPQSNARLTSEQLRPLDALISKRRSLDANKMADALEKTYPNDPRLMLRRLRIYKALKYWREAEDLGLRAIPAAEATGDDRFLFDVLDVYADILWLDEKEDLSRENIRKMTKYRDLHPASRMVEVAEKLKDDRLLLRAYARRALCHRIESGKFQYLVAVSYWKKYTAVAEKNSWQGDVHHGKLFQARFLSYARKHEEALKIYDEIGVEPHWFTLVATNQWQRIHDRAAAALAGQESWLAGITSEDQKRRAIGWNERCCGDYLVAACIRLDKPDEAVEASEKLNGWVIRDLLASKRERLLDQVAEASRFEKRSLTRTIQTSRRQLALAGQSGDDPDVRSLQRDLSVQAEALAGLDERTRRARRDIDVAASGKSLRLPEIQAMLDDETALLIYHVIWSSRLKGGFAAAITRKGYTFAHVPDLMLPDSRPTGGIRGKVEAYRELLSAAGKATGQKAEAKLAALRRSGEDFYAMLIAPIAKEIAGKKRLVIVPGGPLARLPFHLLVDPDGRYLIERFGIGYAQSATVLRFCLARNRKVDGRILAVANPALNDPAFSLQFAEEEARAIQALYPEQCQLLAGVRATVSNFLGAAPNAGILHFACHGIQDSSDAMQSFLALAPDAGSDGRLTTREIFDLDIHAGLVTLSACETGEGLLSPGQVELVGMIRAWMFAGAPSVVASLWKLDDRATSELMAEFYKNLKTMGRAEALQRAQIEMMKKYKNPYYWGAFVLYGDYR